MALTFILMVLSLVGIFRTNIETSFSLFAPNDSPYAAGAALMEDTFGDNAQLLILVPAGSSITEVRDIARLAGMIEQMKDVGTVLVPIDSSMLDASDEQISSYINQLPEKEMGSLFFSQTIDGVKTQYQVLRVQLDTSADTRKLVNNIEQLVNSEFPGSVLSGEPYLESEIFDYVLSILLFLPPAAVLLMLGVFRFRIGSMRATVLSMIPAVIGAVLTLGMLCWIKGTISIMSVLVPIFIIVLGSADGLHMTSHVMDELGDGSSNLQAIAATLHTIGIPIIMTSLTTAAGFLSLMLVDSPAIHEMAVVAAIGILLAGIVTWLVLPVLLAHQKPLPARSTDKKSHLVSMLRGLKGLPIIIFSLSLIAFSVPGLMKLEANFSMLDMYKPDTEIRQSIDRVTEVTGGALPVSVLIETDSPRSTETRRIVTGFQNSLDAESVSIYSVLDTMAAGLPASASVEMLPKLLERASEIQSDLVANLIHADSDTGKTYLRIIINLASLDTDLLKRIADESSMISENESLTAYPVGSAFDIMEMNSRIIPQQVASIMFALVLVLILTSLSLRSIRLGLVSIIPIALTLLGLYGVMGYLGIDVSIITSIMSGLTIGVGIDYAIHYTSYYRYMEKIGDKNPTNSAMQRVATPVLANALGLSIGFTVMVFSPLQIHTTLSLLMWVTMILSSLLSLVLLPTILGERSDPAGKVIDTP